MKSDTLTLKVFSDESGRPLGSITVERGPVEDGELAAVRVKGVLRFGRVYAEARGVRVEPLRGEPFRVRKCDALGTLVDVDYRPKEKKPKAKGREKWPDWIPG